MVKKRILSLQVSTGTFKQFIDQIIDWAKKNQSVYVCVANVHMIIEAVDSPDFAKIVNEADLVTPDGMPLVKSFKWLHKLKQDRVDGMTLLPELIKNAGVNNISVYFYGGSNDIISHIENYFEKDTFQTKLAGAYSPPFRTLTEIENLEVIENINKSGAGLVFVALGCPKQEKWMNAMKGKINATMIGIGGALPVMLGLQKRAPKFMQDLSLEWLYRLYQEPKRLFRRYFYTNIKFIKLLSKEIIKNKL